MPGPVRRAPGGPATAAALVDQQGLPSSWLAAAGLASLGLLAASLSAWTVEGPPLTDVTSAAAQRFFVDNAAALRVAGFASMVAAGLLVVLAVLLRRIVRTALPGSVLGDLALAGGMLLAANSWLFAALAGASTTTEPGAVDPQLALGWYGLGAVNEYLGDTASIWRGLFVGAVALAGLRARFLPKAVAWFGLGVGLAALLAHLGAAVPSGVFVVLWFAGFLGGLIWLLVLGTSLLLRSRRASR